MTFDEMIDFIIDRIEKGYSNDRRDDGGETNWGISLKAHPELAGKIGSLTRDEAKKIYRKEYFTAASLAKYPSKLRLAVLDGAINHGVQLNNRLVQKALVSLGRRLAVDGVIGPITLRKLKEVDHLDFLVAYLRQRWGLYRRHPDFEWAADGWLGRLFLITAGS